MLSFENLSNEETVHQRVVLLKGTIKLGPGDVKEESIAISTHGEHNDFPPINYDLVSGKFRAIAYLFPGSNTIRVHAKCFKERHSDIKVHLKLPTTSHEVKLVLLLAKDSPGYFDGPDIENPGKYNIDLAIKKMRMAAYLWQCYTAEEMRLAGYGRASFRLEEAHQLNTLTGKATSSKIFSPVVHVLRCDKSIADIRDPNVAQQNSRATKADSLFDFAATAIKSKYPSFSQHTVACMIIDAHYNEKMNLITGHAALGGSAGGLNLAIFGSHNLYTFPETIEDVQTSWKCCQKTPSYLANDCGQCTLYWQNLNIGLGAFMHEVGHALGSPHQKFGVMLRDYVRLNRSFMVQEPAILGDKRLHYSNGPFNYSEECHWHPLDLARFRFHESFRGSAHQLKEISNINNEANHKTQDHPFLSTILNSTFGAKHTNIDKQVEPSILRLSPDHWQLQCDDGIVLVELMEGKDHGDVAGKYYKFIEKPATVINFKWSDAPRYTSEDYDSDKNAKEPTISTALKSIAKLRLVTTHLAQPSFENLEMYAKTSLVQFNDFSIHSQSFPSGNCDIKLIPNYLYWNSAKDVISQITVFAGSFVDGLAVRFRGSDQTFLLGNQGGSANFITLTNDEKISAIILRSGLYIDAMQFVFDSGRISQWFGNSKGGSMRKLKIPKGYTISGFFGVAPNWLHQFGILMQKE